MPRHFTSIISSYFGKFASKEFSPPIQSLVNRSYVKLMGVNMAQFKAPQEYKTLNRLFTREFIHPPKLPKDENLLISGVDALITDTGTIKSAKAYQIKGMSYSINSLFGEFHIKAAKKLEGGEFVNFYLSPRDYHRYHMPMRLKILSLTHIPGRLYPVNFPLLRYKKNLFIENERVVIECEDPKGYTHILVLVGALNVGKMVITFEKEIQTNSDICRPKHYTYKNLVLDRGEMFGWFEMGSTIVTFSQKGSISLDISINQKVNFADILGKVL